MTDDQLSRSTEDYVKAIFTLAAEAGIAQTSAIAEVLGVAPPSVSGMIKRLSEAGLVEHVPYRGVRLTARGRQTALRMLRRHRILESYLVAHLGYDWDTVHDEAERLEHAVSDVLVDRMAEALGNPRFDPHGAPIPSREGGLEVVDLVPLSAFDVGTRGELRRVGDEDPERLRYLAALGLKPGIRFRVTARQPFQGPVTVEIGGDTPRDEVLGYMLAQSLRCAVLEGEA